MSFLESYKRLPRKTRLLLGIFGIIVGLAGPYLIPLAPLIERPEDNKEVVSKSSTWRHIYTLEWKISVLEKTFKISIHCCLMIIDLKDFLNIEESKVRYLAEEHELPMKFENMKTCIEYCPNLGAIIFGFLSRFKSRELDQRCCCGQCFLSFVAQDVTLLVICRHARFEPSYLHMIMFL